MTPLRRVAEPVSLTEAERRLRAVVRPGVGLTPSQIAGIVWPTTRFRSAQGAAFAAQRIIRGLTASGVGRDGCDGFVLRERRNLPRGDSRHLADAQIEPQP